MYVWYLIKAKGRRRFIWHEQVLHLGLPLGIVLAIIEYIKDGHASRELFSLTFLAFLFLAVVLTASIAYLLGRVLWSIAERKTRSSH